MKIEENMQIFLDEGWKKHADILPTNNMLEIYCIYCENVTFKL